MYWVQAPAAVGRLLGSFEAFAALRHYRSDGILQGRSSRRSKSLVPLPARKLLDTTGGAVVVEGLAVFGAALVISGLGRRKQQAVGSSLLFLSKKLAELRNPFGGDGADQMSDVICGYRILTIAIPVRNVSDDLFLRAVNAQVVVSYLASGLAKVISSTWRSGDAIDLVLRTKLYGGSGTAALIRKYPTIGRLLSWSTIGWETAYPLVYFMGPLPAKYFLLLIKGFHLGIAVTMGLPRFFWAFSSAHVAVEYVLRERGQR